ADDVVTTARPPERSFEERADALEQRAVARHGGDARERIVLGLRHHLARDELRVGALVRDDQNLGRSRESVDAAGAEDLALRLGDPYVAGADDLVDRQDRLRAVRER